MLLREGFALRLCLGTPYDEPLSSPKDAAKSYAYAENGFTST